MLNELTAIKEQAKEQLAILKKQINARKTMARFSSNVNQWVKAAEFKVAQIEDLLVKIEQLTEQIQPVLHDLAEIIGYKKKGD